MISNKMLRILVVVPLFIILVLDYFYLQVTPVKGVGKCAKCEPRYGRFDCISQQDSGGSMCTVSGDGKSCHLTGPCGDPPPPPPAN